MSADAQYNEDWFLAQVERPDTALPELLRWLARTRDAGDEQRADSSAEYLQEALRERGARDQALAVLEMRTAWRAADGGFRKTCAEQAVAILTPPREHRVLVEQAGFAGAVPLPECFRRLRALRALAPGVLCNERTWGFGVVRKVDLFYQNTVIDFEKRREHTMTLAYAAETLELISKDHLLARRHMDPQAVAALVRDDPAEVVRITLRSYGPLSAAQLQATLAPRIVAEDDWKRFWDGARKGLKKDPMIEMPAKRTEPIRLLDREKSYDAAWFESLRVERRMDPILAMIEEFRRESGVSAPDAAMLDVLGERLAYVIRGAVAAEQGELVLAIMLAREFGVSKDQVDTDAHIARFLDPEPFLAAVRQVAARDVRRFLDHLKARDAERSLDMLLGVLTRLEMTGLNEAMGLLLESGREEAAARIIREQTEGQCADVEVLYWLVRHPEKMAAWGLGSLPDLARWAMRGLEKDHCGERLKTQNQLRNRFSEGDWIAIVLREMSEGERRDLTARIKDNPAWTTLDRRSLLGKIIKLYPELQDVLVAKAESAPASALRGPVTSHRMYRERQAQLEKIVHVEIPRIAREIGKARSYGDLSENYEYKAAKEMQAFLMRRQAELEKMLHTVRPTDFEGFPADAAGQATAVCLEYPDGRRERYVILGVWDTEEKLGIISSDTRLAQVLEGHRAGDEVTVPGEHGDAACRLAEVAPLSQAIRDWVRGEAAPEKVAP